jgi:hypothetical protein
MRLKVLSEEVVIDEVMTTAAKRTSVHRVTPSEENVNAVGVNDEISRELPFLCLLLALNLSSCRCEALDRIGVSAGQ